MLRKLYMICSFHGWRNLVELVLASCAVCQASVGPRPCEPLRPILASTPVEHFCLDFVQLAQTPADGKFYVLVLIDHFSKFVWARLTLDREAATVEKFLADVFAKHAPDHLQSDNGKEFRAKLVKDLCAKNDVRTSHGRPYRPQSQGAVERVNQTIMSALIRQLLDALEPGTDVDLKRLLQQVVDTYNSSPPAGRKYSPVQVTVRHFL